MTMIEFTERETRQIDRANESGRTPVVFIHGLWLLPSSWDAWANAVAPPRATNEEVDAAEQRAVELVSNMNEDWTLETREETADAWRALWLA
jgi:hypothetical protein